MPSGSFGVLSNLTGKVDQGIDFGGTGPIPALGRGVVTDITYSHIQQDKPGQGPWPVLVYKLLGGPHRGQYVYVAENFTPTVKVGDHVRQGQQIGYANGSFPYIEVGFNQGPTGWRAYGSPDSPQPQGYAMKQYIASLIGHTKVTGVTVPSSGGDSGQVSKLLRQYKNPDGTYGTKHVTLDAIVKMLAHLAQLILGGKLSTAQASQAASKQTGIPASAFPFNTAPLGGIPGGGAIESALNPFKDVAAFFSWLFSVRGLETLGGGFLMLMGIYLLVRQVGLAADVPVPSPVKAAALAVPAARKVATKTRRSPAPSAPSYTPSRRQQIIHHYHPVGSPADDRHDRASRARPISDPATNEIPY